MKPFGDEVVHLCAREVLTRLICCSPFDSRLGEEQMVAFKELDNIEPGASLDGLKRSQVVDLQSALAFISYQSARLTGEWDHARATHGPNSRRISTKGTRPY